MMTLALTPARRLSSMLTRRISTMPLSAARPPAVTVGSHNVFGGGDAAPAAAAAFAKWHSAVDLVLHGEADTAEAMASLRPHMDPQCVFRPPTYYKPWHGRDETLLLLGTVGEVFGSSFEYGRQWLSDDAREWALEFSAEVGGKSVHGIDLVSLNEAGLISEFTVLARPPNAVAALKDEMMRRVPVRLAKLKAKQALGLVG